jgi:hypothetical protein
MAYSTFRHHLGAKFWITGCMIYVCQGQPVASHECLGRAVAVGTWVVVVIVHGKSANQGIYWWKDHRKERCALSVPSQDRVPQRTA